mmetsp:Transcript_3463/g.5888  ORF Transcript_3463/g.5888 Transcript_3463/m.5888 type:complete len:180 (+) Transcript_3463:1969-2508(+)
MADRGDDDYADTSNSAEGAYLMKPDKNNRRSYPYLNETVRSTSFQRLGHLSQWEFVFQAPDSDSNNATNAVVRARFAQNYSKFLELEVELNGIPISDDWGKDVTVNIQLEDFEANQTFYTDSNGLEMQERRINFRPSWNYSGIQNISSNFYPVNSAIALRHLGADGAVERQATLLNDKS